METKGHEQYVCILLACFLALNVIIVIQDYEQNFMNQTSSEQNPIMG